MWVLSKFGSFRNALANAYPDLDLGVCLFVSFFFLAAVAVLGGVA